MHDVVLHKNRKHQVLNENFLLLTFQLFFEVSSNDHPGQLSDDQAVSNPDELLINVLLPNGGTDLVVTSSDTLATDLHREVIIRAGCQLEVNDSDVFSKFSGHHYVLDTHTLIDIGMYSGCFVSVRYCNSWIVYVDIPDGETLKISADASTTGRDLHHVVIH